MLQIVQLLLHMSLQEQLIAHLAQAQLLFSM